MKYDNLGLVSTSESDWWIYQPLIRALPGIQVYRNVGAEGSLETGYRMLGGSLNVDAMFVLGDRLEMLGAAIALTQKGIPLYHIGGGAVTSGSLDDYWRSCITKLAAVHYVESKEHAKNVLSLGEEFCRIHVVGELGLANLRGYVPDPPMYPDHVVVAYHPNTMNPDSTLGEIRAIIEGVRRSGKPAVFTKPNRDQGWEIVEREILEAGFPLVRFGPKKFWDQLCASHCILGNSSAGIIEAPALGCPSIQTTERQRNRPGQRPALLWCPCLPDDIAVSINSCRDLASVPINNLNVVGDRSSLVSVDHMADERIRQLLPPVDSIPSLRKKSAPSLANSLALCGSP